MKVLIIDDHKLFADGLRELLREHDSSICIEYSGNVFIANDIINGIDAPNLILLSINDIATENSYDLIDQLKMQNRDIPVMVISSADSAAAAALAIKNNASAFITKSCQRETMLTAITSVLDGNMYVCKLKKEDLNNNEINKCEIGRVTIRQQEVLYLLSQGLLNKQIASELDISGNTVKTHLHDLFRHLNVTNRTAAVMNGYKRGLI